MNADYVDAIDVNTRLRAAVVEAARALEVESNVATLGVGAYAPELTVMNGPVAAGECRPRQSPAALGLCRWSSVREPTRESATPSRRVRAVILCFVH